MRVFIELPTWLGDAVMASSAICLLRGSLKDAKFVFFGSAVSVKLYEELQCCEWAIIDDSKAKSGLRMINLYKSLSGLGKFDLAFSFRSSFASKFALFCIKADFKACFKKGIPGHQVQKYESFIKQALLNAHITVKEHKSELNLPFKAHKFNRPTLGINPGASYGSAKRWDSKRFAEVADSLSHKYDIVIFGSKAEEDICKNIQKHLQSRGKEALNLAGKTSIKELCELIAGLELFITNDSGPMHIAAAYAVPSVAIFGSTRVDETAPYKPAKAVIVRLDPPLKCMPCMQRVCPLKTNKCLNLITTQMVLKAATNLTSHQI